MQEANGPVTFLNKTYDESMTLLVEARNNLAHGGVEERDQLDLAGKLTFSLEAMRLTATLTQSMAWLLVQKAVFAGEMTREDAARAPNRLGGHSVCLDGGAGVDRLPAGVRRLLERARRLYIRVQRLNGMLGDGAVRSS